MKEERQKQTFKALECSDFYLKGATSFGLQRVLLSDSYYQNALEKEIKYLLSFDIDRLLAGFRETAGIDQRGAKRYSGWENTLIGGHTLGHYVTACVQACQCANTTPEQKKKLKDMLSEIMQGLQECQEAVGTGFLFGAVVLDKERIELQFDNVENQKTNITTQAWVPWYTLHKIMEGLLSAAQMSEEDTIHDMALEVAEKLGDWVCNRVNSWSADTRNIVLSIEYGGMNDCLYDLYQLTHNEKYAEAAHIFDQTELFKKVLYGKPGENILNNLHANTTIPKFLGALNRYLTFPEAKQEEVSVYLQYAEAFWEMVVNLHTYITGGNSEWEHFGFDTILDAERTNCNCESCNAYNMLKLTKKLFQITGDKKYADFYETTFVNSILSSQNPQSGMTTYFQPMATGYFKVFGEPYTKFWCCTGTGMENFTKLGDGIYYQKENILIVNQYMSSVCDWKEKKVKVTLETQIPKSDQVVCQIICDSTADITIAFRLPNWLTDRAVVLVNHSVVPYEAHDGYAFVSGPFFHGTKIVLTFPLGVRAYALPDRQSVYGFQYGPVVLSALLGSTEMTESTTGVEVTIPYNVRIEKKYTSTECDTIVVKTDTVEEFIEQIENNLVPKQDSETLAFTLQHTEANLTFVSHYAQYKERYGIYWNFTTKKEWLERTARLADYSDKNKHVVLDTVQPGYGQYENDVLHQMKEYKTGSTGLTATGTARYANAGGAFSYRMIVETKEETNLLVTVKKEDNGKMLKIQIKNSVVYEQRLHSKGDASEYEILICLPKEILEKQAEIVTIKEQIVTVVTLLFEGALGEESARICNFLYTIKPRE